MEELRQIFDRAFKRLFSLSNAAVISLINGLFGTDHPPDSSVVYTNRESTNASLRHRFADVFVLIGGRFHYHLEAQMSYSNDIIVRVFEYGFHHALESRRDGSLCLEFPEPVVIYLSDRDDIPPEDVLHIHFQGLGSIDYRVRNIVYLRQSSEEILQKKLIMLIPFQVLRLRSFLFDKRGHLKQLDKNECDLEFPYIAIEMKEKQPPMTFYCHRPKTPNRRTENERTRISPVRTGHRKKPVLFCTIQMISFRQSWRNAGRLVLNQSLTPSFA